MYLTLYLFLPLPPSHSRQLACPTSEHKVRGYMGLRESGLGFEKLPSVSFKLVSSASSPALCSPDGGLDAGFDG